MSWLHACAAWMTFSQKPLCKPSLPAAFGQLCTVEFGDPLLCLAACVTHILACMPVSMTQQHSCTKCHAARLNNCTKCRLFYVCHVIHVRLYDFTSPHPTLHVSNHCVCVKCMVGLMQFEFSFLSIDNKQYHIKQLHGQDMAASHSVVSTIACALRRKMLCEYRDLVFMARKAMMALYRLAPDF